MAGSSVSIFSLSRERGGGENQGRRTRHVIVRNWAKRKARPRHFSTFMRARRKRDVQDSVCMSIFGEYTCGLPLCCIRGSARDVYDPGDLVMKMKYRIRMHCRCFYLPFEVWFKVFFFSEWNVIKKSTYYLLLVHNLQ